MRMNDWAELKFKASQTVPYPIVSELNARQKLLLALWRPRDFRRWLGLRFRKHTMIPGDVFHDFQRNTMIYVVGVKSQAVFGEVYDRRNWDDLGGQPAPPHVPRHTVAEGDLTPWFQPGVHVAVRRFDRFGPEVEGWVLP